MKAVESFACTGVLPTARAHSVTVFTAASSVRIVRTTSTSFISGTGLKKCTPSTCPGRLVAAAIVLEGLVLGHRLHDEIGGLEVLQPRRARDAPQRLVLRLRLELALGHEALERLAQPLEAARDERVVGLDEQHVEAGLRRDLHDAGAHETAAYHSDVLDGHESFL